MLELKEELQRAENDLVKLKKQWASFEANKKRSEIRHVERMQPLNRPNDGSVAADDISARAQHLKRLERPARKTQQRVFEGSKHTRTLSLLSPTATEKRSSESPSPIIGQTPSPQLENDNLPEPLAAINEPTPAEFVSPSFSKTYKDLANRHSLPPASRDAFVKTGKQMATDLKEGFWTFVEDIRQATVGEEGISATDNRTLRMSNSEIEKPNSQSTGAVPKTSKSREQLSSIPALNRQISSASKTSMSSTDNRSFWEEFGLETPQQKKSTRKTTADAGKGSSLITDLLDQDDHWDLWDSPAVPLTTQKSPSESQKHTLRHSNSTIGSHATNDTHADSTTQSHRTSTSSVDTTTDGSGNSSTSQTDDKTIESTTKDNNIAAIPWPKKLHPARLSRTISDIMKEFEIDGPINEEALAAAEAEKARTD